MPLVERLSRTTRLAPTTLLLIATNLIPLAGVAFWGWHLGTVSAGDVADVNVGQSVDSPARSRLNASSSRTGTPRSCAFASLEPAFSPATR